MLYFQNIVIYFYVYDDSEIIVLNFHQQYFYVFVNLISNVRDESIILLYCKKFTKYKK